MSIENLFQYNERGRNGRNDRCEAQSVILILDTENPAILYLSERPHEPPLLVLSFSSSEVSNGATLILGVNTTHGSHESYIFFGASQRYDTHYDLRPYLKTNGFDFDTRTFFSLDTTCDALAKGLSAASLFKNWNLVAVYESAAPPWYTGGSTYDWRQVCSARVFFTTRGVDASMTLALKSIYLDIFEKTWKIVLDRQEDGTLKGINIDENIHLSIAYADAAGNLVLTAGPTTAFFLSTSITSPEHDWDLFVDTLADIGYTPDDDNLYPIYNFDRLNHTLSYIINYEVYAFILLIYEHIGHA